MTKMIIAGLVVLLLALPAWADEWQEPVLSGSPEARYGHTMVTINNQVYLYGGEGSSSGSESSFRGLYFGDSWRFMGEQAKWEKLQASNPPPARKFHSSVVVNGKMYVLFGEDPQGQPLGDVWEYDPGGNTWTRKETSAPAEPRSQHSSVVIDGRIYIYGGKGGSGWSLQDLWRYDPDSAINPWEQKASGPTSFRSHEGVVYNGQMYIHTFTRSLWRYKPTEDTWDYIVPENTIPARVFQTDVQTENLMLVFGGEDLNGAEFKDSWAYNFNTNTWIPRTDIPVPLTQSAGL